MNTAPAPTPTRPRRRWLRRLLVALAILIGLPAAYYSIQSWSLNRDINSAIAETDARDPRWRYEDLEADSKQYPDAENSALQIVKVVGLIGRRMGNTPSSHKHYGEIFDELTPTAQLNPQQIQLIREIFENAPEGLTEARKLKDFPHGRFAVQWDPSGLWMLLPDHHEVRTVCDLLQHDAMLRCQFGDPEAAMESCRALLNASRAVADDVIIISLYIRMGNLVLLTSTLERILAQANVPDAPLRQMQTLLRAESADLSRQWLVAVRGERAEFHRFYEPLITGKKRWLQMAESLRMRVGWEDQLAHYLPMRLTKEYAHHLRLRNEMVAVARLPLPEQLERFIELEKKVDRSDRRRNDLSGILPLLPPDLAKTCALLLRCQALVRAAETGLACERFRSRHQSWPATLDATVQAGLLESIPVDPFDGQPLRLARRGDGITIFSVGKDRVDNGGHIVRNHPNEMGVDIGFRLWDPAKRRQAPRPPVALP